MAAPRRGPAEADAARPSSYVPPRSPSRRLLRALGLQPTWLLSDRLAVSLAGGVAREVEATVRTALFPLHPLRPLPPAQPAPGRLPLLVVHGFLGHPGMMRPLSRYLLERGWPRVERVGYPSVGVPFDAILDRIDAAAARVGGPFDVLGHSLGASALRAWLQDPGRAAVGQVRRFVAMAPPFGGTDLYRLVPGALREALDPNGERVRALQARHPPVPTVLVRARYDRQVLPVHPGDLPGVREVVLDGLGHNGLLCSTRAHREIAAILSEP